MTGFTFLVKKTGTGIRRESHQTLRVSESAWAPYKHHLLPRNLSRSQPNTCTSLRRTKLRGAPGHSLSCRKDPAEQDNQPQPPMIFFILCFLRLLIFLSDGKDPASFQLLMLSLSGMFFIKVGDYLKKKKLINLLKFRKQSMFWDGESHHHCKQTVNSPSLKSNSFQKASDGKRSRLMDEPSG